MKDLMQVTVGEEGERRERRGRVVLEKLGRWKSRQTSARKGKGAVEHYEMTQPQLLSSTFSAASSTRRVSRHVHQRWACAKIPR